MTLGATARILPLLLASAACGDNCLAGGVDGRATITMSAGPHAGTHADYPVVVTGDDWRSTTAGLDLDAGMIMQFRQAFGFGENPLAYESNSIIQGTIQGVPPLVGRWVPSAALLQTDVVLCGLSCTESETPWAMQPLSAEQGLFITSVSEADGRRPFTVEGPLRRHVRLD